MVKFTVEQKLQALNMLKESYSSRSVAATISRKVLWHTDKSWICLSMTNAHKG